MQQQQQQQQPGAANLKQLPPQLAYDHFQNPGTIEVKASNTPQHPHYGRKMFKNNAFKSSIFGGAASPTAVSAAVRDTRFARDPRRPGGKAVLEAMARQGGGGGAGAKAAPRPTHAGAFGVQSEFSQMNMRAQAQASEAVANAALLNRYSNEMSGPLDHSNWIVKGRVLCGASLTSRDVAVLRPLAIDTYICLQSNTELRYARTDYHHQLKRLHPGAAFVQFPLDKKGAAPNIQELNAFIEQLVKLYNAGAKMYIHCLDGHERTALVCSLLLGRLSGAKADDATKMIRLYHSARVMFGHVQAPKLQSNLDIIKALLG
jgi:hypothetical protein